MSRTQRALTNEQVKNLRQDKMTNPDFDARTYADFYDTSAATIRSAVKGRGAYSDIDTDTQNLYLIEKVSSSLRCDSVRDHSKMGYKKMTYKAGEWLHKWAIFRGLAGAIKQRSRVRSWDLDDMELVNTNERWFRQKFG